MIAARERMRCHKRAGSLVCACTAIIAASVPSTLATPRTSSAKTSGPSTLDAASAAAVVLSSSCCRRRTDSGAFIKARR
jgi:hypothetical protein